MGLPNGETPVVAAIGVPIVDMVGYLEEFPKRGGHSPGLALDVAPGGPVINLVAGVSRLGHPSILLGKMGRWIFSRINCVGGCVPVRLSKDMNAISLDDQP